MRTDLDDRLDALAGRQLGLLSRHEVLAQGGTDHYIRTCIERKRWQQLQAAVYLTGSAPPSWLQFQLAACMAAGPPAVASHRAAAAVWWLDGACEGAVELTVTPPFGPAPRKTIVHRSLRWQPEHHTVRRKVPVTDINRTLIDYAAVVPPILSERAVEDAFRRRYTNEGALRRRLAIAGGHGARGAGRLRAVLDARPAGRPARSGFEVMMLDVLRRYGLPMPVRNHVVKVEGVPVAELDLAYVDEMIDLEANGAKWHTTRRQRQRDAERRAILETLGWDVQDFDYDEVVYRPEYAAARVRTLLCGSSTALPSVIRKEREVGVGRGHEPAR
jgi:hypothetical protein